MFRMTYAGDKYETPDVLVVAKAVHQMRDAEVVIEDLRSGGKHFNLTIDEMGGVVETYGPRFIVRDVLSLLETPGGPVYHCVPSLREKLKQLKVEVLCIPGNEDLTAYVIAREYQLEREEEALSQLVN